MKRLIANVSSGYRAWRLASVACFLGILPESALGQSEGNADYLTESAHLHSPDMSCCAPCAPEGNQDPDVFKRPRFLRALGKSLKAGQSSAGLMFPDGMNVPAGQTAATGLAAFLNLLSSVLQPAFLPQAWEGVKFYIPYPPKKAAMELRSGVKTFVGYEPDHAAGGNELKEGDAIQTGWAIGGVEVLPRVLYAPKPPQYADIRLRLHGDERLELGRRPDDFTRTTKDFGAFFNRNAFHALLVKVFRVPFESLDDFVVDGYDTEYEGVRVFHGQIRSRERSTRLRPDRSQPPRHWWDEMRLLVTDSDPQYFCVQVVFRQGDE